MKKTLHFCLVLFLCSLLLSSCNLDKKNYPFNYGDAVWMGDLYDARINVTSDGKSNQEIGEITLNGERIEVVFLFTPGWVDICYYRGDNIDETVYNTDEDSFCSCNPTYSSDGSCFSITVESSENQHIPVGTTITFTRQSDEMSN